ncbi:MAG: transketolase [Alphaproteobacteria bacterium RIFCSPLOWO2_01_FULL_40_26]|nr:MAG: transketolase [Alphaproteobacteria bacterium RIFCSPHIGHO2_02_FULL_40_34]OFW94253.1 MAG: transketolase [Alphaproteobacteria bacterium RIFCSPLOWO2_01_FULL_40_26]OFX09822.1 MAG: transketolase [Alphaproteobacteria bacterium RIFCSPLOWO2_02_FULL_40_19]OFX11405.1 MAG: transketolase [Alphaproteobacteria bacterium RIFCSPLOWO2_12_FULL_40_11]
MTKTDLSNCIRFLSADAVERANSGHPGMPMGMADVATILFLEFLKFDPKNPKWLNRDRFVLSAGHGSMLLYSLLYLTGYEDITLDDLKNFRQLHSKCAGHPEFGHLAGIETTTGPLGQGLANAVGMAIAEKILAARYGKIFDHKTYTIVGDGCLMEGISQEAISLAGHLNLNKLVVLWDNNSISIDGKTSLTTSENMKRRFEACGFRVLQIDGHNFDEIRTALKKAKNSKKPLMIDCKTTIGFGAPNKAGTEKCHGSPLGAEEIKKTREKLGWQYEPFAIPDHLLAEWRKCGINSKNWERKFKKSGISLATNPLQNIDLFRQKILDEKQKQATRKSSQQILEFLTAQLPNLIGGSADLTESVLTKTSHSKTISAQDFSGSYIHYGVREHAMAAAMNGIALHSNFIPYGGTFLVFCDYMKPAIRLAALMKQQVIYIFTHDSIGLGEDGPTHQPVEHLAMLRAIPNLNVLRPCDMEETLACFELALAAKKTPSAIVLTRQNLPFLNKDSQNYHRGGYVISACENPDVVIIATGSEVVIAMEAQEKLKQHQINARVVSMPCFEIFEQQDEIYKHLVLGDKNILRVGIEAAISQGFEKYLGCNGIFIGMNDFGASAKGEDLFKHFGITADNVVEKVKLKIN